MYYALLQADVAGRDLSSLRVGISGGAAIPGEVIRAFEEKFPKAWSCGGFRPVRDRQHHDLQRQREAAQRLPSASPSGEWRSGWWTSRTSRSPRAGEHRRDRHPGPQRDEGLLPAAGGDRRGIPRRLVRHRRPGPRRRGRLPVHRRPQEGPGDPRRLQRLSARGRGGPVRSPSRGRGRRRRQAGPARGRGSGRVHRAKAGRGRQAGGDHRILPGAAGGLQVPARGPGRRRTAEGADREDPQEGWTPPA